MHLPLTQFDFTEVTLYVRQDDQIRLIDNKPTAVAFSGDDGVFAIYSITWPSHEGQGGKELSLLLSGCIGVMGLVSCKHFVILL